MTAEERTALHEAGHAVAATFLHHAAKVRRVTITPDRASGSLGHVRGWVRPSVWRAVEAGDTSLKSLLHLTEEVLVLLAGEIAERRAGARLVWGAGTDRENAADIANALSGDPRQANAFLRWLIIRAENLVALRWVEVQAVAAALLEHKTLTRDQIHAIIFPRPVGRTRRVRGPRSTQAHVRRAPRAGA